MSNVVHPSHYNIEGRKECIVEMLEKFGEEAVKTFCILNAYKYRYRHELKGGAEDLQKAEWYENYASKLPKGIKMIAIKNMDMPKTCKECIFCIRQRCLILNKSSFNSIYHDLKRKDCPILDKYEAESEG